MSPKLPSSGAKRDNTTPSCAVCNRRKVKCDRVYPCGPCRKTGLECSFPEPARKRARRKLPTPSPENTSERHRSTRSSGSNAAQRDSKSQILAQANGSTRRTFDGVIYGLEGDGSAVLSLGDSCPGPTPESHDNRFDPIFGLHARPSHEPLRISMAQAITIGNAYMKYVDPVVKIFRCTSAWECLGHSDSYGWEGEEVNLGRPADQCLFRTMCFVTAVATEGADLDGSFEMRGQALIQRCRLDAENALSAVGFTKTGEFRVLQSMVTYLIAMQSLGENETVWSMLGMAIRVASTIGLPQDIGEGAVTSSALTPYQIEIRRRLWWAIIALDARVTRILGRTGYLSHNFSDVPKPSNINDDRLFPSMSGIADSSGSLTDSVYVRYRATLSDVLPFIYAPGNTNDKCTGLMEMIDDAERQLEDEYVQHCDQSIPIQLLTSIASRGYIKRVKLAMYSIYPESASIASDSPYASDAFRLAKESMEIFVMLWTEPSLKQWQWHWKDFFGWHTLRVMVQEIAKRSSSSKAIDAWKLVKKAASLVVSALKLGEEKARLVGDLRMLIEAADIHSGLQEHGHIYRSDSTVRNSRPGMGTRPHNALLPGMDSPSTTVEGEISDDASREVESDLKRVNWVEMDRLLLQLGTYSGG